jgi:hypothetical protein
MVKGRTVVWNTLDFRNIIMNNMLLVMHSKAEADNVGDGTAAIKGNISAVAFS